jgi:hypothetical protein
MPLWVSMHSYFSYRLVRIYDALAYCSNKEIYDAILVIVLLTHMVQLFIVMVHQFLLETQVVLTRHMIELLEQTNGL